MNNSDQHPLTAYKLAIGEIARQVNSDGIEITEAAVRKYIKRTYTEFFPSFRPDGERWPKYPIISIEIIKTIVQMSVEEGKSRQEIKELLHEKFGSDLEKYQVVVDSSRNTRTPTTPKQLDTHTGDLSLHRSSQDEQARALGLYNQELAQSALLSLEGYRQLLGRKDEQLRELFEENTELSQANTDQQQQIDELTEELKKAKRGGLWQRLTGDKDSE